MEVTAVFLILSVSLVFRPNTGAWAGSVLRGPRVSLEGQEQQFFCEVPGVREGPTLLFRLYQQEAPLRLLGEYSSLSGEMATFTLTVSSRHDGTLVCHATHTHNHTHTHTSNTLQLRVITPVLGVNLSSDWPVDDLWEGRTVTLHCNWTRGSYVSIEWLRGGVALSTPSDPAPSLTLHRLSLHDSGQYVCVTSNRLSHNLTFSASSDPLTLKVKELVSGVSAGLEEVVWSDGVYWAVVVCGVERGSPLLTFSLLNDTGLVGAVTTLFTTARFFVPIRLDHHMGRVRCNASNRGNWAESRALSLTVESVGGAVSVTVTRQVGGAFQVVGVALRCAVERGTLPLFLWFVNGSRLRARGRFHAVAGPDQSLLLVGVGSHSAGLYHCEASDRFRNHSRVRGAQILISSEELNGVSSVVVLVVLGCVLVLLVSLLVCCVSGLLLWDQRSAVKHDLSAGEDPDTEDEDDGMLQTSDEDGVRSESVMFIEAEGESVDETLLYGPSDDQDFSTLTQSFIQRQTIDN